MKRWKKFKKSWLIAAVTGIIIVGAGIVILANASGLQSVFEPGDYEKFENQYDNSDDYHTTAGDGEESDLADEDMEGEDTPDDKMQKALKVAENEDDGENDKDSLGMADDSDHADGSKQEKNPDAFEISDERGNGRVDVAPGDRNGKDPEAGNGKNPGNGGGDIHPSGPAEEKNTGIPNPTGGLKPTNVPEPTNAPTQIPTNVPSPTETPAPTVTPQPTVRPELKPRDPVETEHGVLVKLSAVINREYYQGDIFQESDAKVTATFRQTDTTKKIIVPYGGKNGYQVRISTKQLGTHRAVFTYLGMTASAQYEVISSGVSVRYHASDQSGSIFAVNFPGPLGGDQETMDKLSERNFIPTAGGIVDLTDIHSRMTAYLGDETIKKNFQENTSYKNVVFLEEKDGYLTNMLCGFQYYISGELEGEQSYVYYPVYNWGANALRNVINVVKEVPEDYRIRRVVQEKDNLIKYRGSQVLERYLGNDTRLSVPMGVTEIALEGEQGSTTVTSMVLPESVDKVDFASVSECLSELENYEVSGHSIFHVEEGVLYSKNGKRLISVPAGKTGVRIPAAAAIIASGAFRNSSIRALTVPDTVDELEDGCFSGFYGDVIRIEGRKIPKISSNTGYSGKVLFVDSIDNMQMKQGIFAFQSSDIIFGAMDEKGEEIPEKTGIYQYDSRRHILNPEGKPTVLAGIQMDAQGRYVVPEGITAVEAYAFAGADGLCELEFPENVAEFREKSLILSDRVEGIFLSAEMAEISPAAFGNPSEGAKVPDITVYVPEKSFNSYLDAWSQVLDPVYGKGTAKGLLRADDGTTFYENGARYEKVKGAGCEYYRLLKVYGQDQTAFAVKEGTTEITSEAFSVCERLEILCLPDTLKTVENKAFAGCKSLQTVTVGTAGVLSGNVFDSLSSQVRIYEKGTRFCEFLYEQGIVYGKSPEGWHTLIDVPTDYGTEVVLYENTRCLNEEAFKNCTFLEKIEIPDQGSLTEIGERCFENCQSIKSIRLSDAVHLERIGEEAFGSCTGLTELYLPSQINGAQQRLCYECTSLQIVEAEGIQHIQEEAFFNCQNLLSNRLSLNWDGMTKIDNRAFAYCSLLTSVPEMPELESLGDQVFYVCQRLRQIVLPETLKSMGEECFGECTSLVRAELNGKLAGISRYCFYGCRQLSEIIFSEQQKNSLQVAGVQAFGQCTSLESLDLSGFPLLMQMGERAFSGCDFLTTVKLPEGFSRIPDYCFENCPNLSILVLLSEQAVELGETVWGETLPSFLHIWVKEGSLDAYRKAYEKVLDPVYGTGTTENILGRIEPDKEMIRGVTFEITPEGRILKEVSEAFEGAYTVPADTIMIDSEAFMNCVRLIGIILPSGSSIRLGDRCFKGCTSLERVELRGDIPQWGEETFMECTSLKKLDIGVSSQENVSRVGTRAFKGCTGLVGRESVAFRASMPILGEECFAECVNLEAVPMSERARLSIETIERKAFSGCKSLAQFITSAFRGVKTIDAYAFSDCDSLANPSIPASVTWIGEGLFSECENIQTVSFYCVLEEYPKDCFKNCPKLKRTGGVAGALSGLKKIGESAYEGCISLETNERWDVGKYVNLEEIGEDGFKDCRQLTFLKLPASMKKIGEGAFDGGSSIRQVNFYSAAVPEMGRIGLDGLSDSFCIKVPDSQAEDDRVYKAYLAVFTEMFGGNRAYEVLDSISDGAKERNRPEVSAADRQLSETVSGADISENGVRLPKQGVQLDENREEADKKEGNGLEKNETEEIIE